jgi:hypothetical protein
MEIVTAWAVTGTFSLAGRAGFAAARWPDAVALGAGGSTKVGGTLVDPIGVLFGDGAVGAAGACGTAQAESTTATAAPRASG